MIKKFHIPFTISSIDRLKKRSSFFLSKKTTKKKSSLQSYLEYSNIPLTSQEYLAICKKNFIVHFIIFLVISSTSLVLANVSSPYLISLGISFLLSAFILCSQIIYPKVYNSRREKDIDKNLISALQDILVQLNSGIPLFSIMVNISSANYGALSEEFRLAAKKINAGYPQVEVLEEMGERNLSPYFRRTLWQISNGMRAGSDISIVIKESTKSLNEEQIIQIQTYGNKLNPLIMFYMLISVILPALSITFLTIISSLLNLPESSTILLFDSLFAMVVIIQVMFLGVIKSTRPRLL